MRRLPGRRILRDTQHLMGFISRGFKGKRRDTASSSRVPPGQYVVNDFPVLSAGPTPRAVARPAAWPPAASVGGGLGWCGGTLCDGRRAGGGGRRGATNVRERVGGGRGGEAVRGVAGGAGCDWAHERAVRACRPVRD